MILSAFYMAATVLQCLRLRSVMYKMSKLFSKPGSSVVFYNLCEDTTDAVSSKLCSNQRESRIVDLMWYRATQRGCTVQPRQVIAINPWITFPQVPINIPIKLNDLGTKQLNENPIYVLVEAQFQLGNGKADDEPFMGFPNYKNNLYIEEFGYPLAWKVDTHFAFLLQTDEERLSKLILATFMSNNFSINNDLQLFRIETVDLEGVPQPFESMKQHINSNLIETGSHLVDNPTLREKYIGLLTDLCSWARQADELDFERARQEKPDLIASSYVLTVEATDQVSFPDHSGRAEKKAVVDKKNPLKRTKRSQGSFMGIGKPPNILIYSESLAMTDNALTALRSVLKSDTYTVYPLSTADVRKRIWQENTQLLVVCGSISQEVGSYLLEFYLNQSGKMLCLCSDLLNLLLPNYRTAEVREQELAQFSYKRWQKVHMMHHIFCYQPSPIKKHFSHDGEESHSAHYSKNICPKTVEITDSKGIQHDVDVQILGVEETWQTPSILLATERKNNGRAIFSQVHLEADPNQFEWDGQKFEILKNSNVQRLEILSDILVNHLNVEVQRDNSKSEIQYTPGYLLGESHLKAQFMKSIQSNCDTTGYLSSGTMNLFFTAEGQATPKPTERFLPIQINNCNPEFFNFQRYFVALNTKEIGRLVIYIPTVTSSMDVLDKLTLGNGLVVIPKYQTNGTGRNKNKWLSADGCLMFTLQLKIRLNSVLGQRIPLIQHLVAAAITNSIVGQNGYQVLDLRIKWPNDIYANGTIKIGGLIVATTIEGDEAICNVGVGLNLDNGAPTICINDLIRDMNREAELDLGTMEAETLFAQIFNEIERLLDEVEEKKNLDDFYDLYYQLWLHQDQEVKVQDEQDRLKSGVVAGIDEYGYLKVNLEGGRKELSVHPDGNSFDMLRGLILPKFN